MPIHDAAHDGERTSAAAERTLARSVDATIDVLVSPRAGFEAIARGIHLWIPLLCVAACRTCWLIAQYPAARRPDRIVINLGVQSLIAALLYAVMTLPIMGALWIQGGRFRSRSVLAVVLCVGFVTELGALLAALVSNALLDMTVEPASQTLTNFAGFVPETTNRPLHHILAQLDAIKLYGVGLVAYGAGMMVRELTRQQVMWTVLTVWSGWLFITTLIKWYVS